MELPSSPEFIISCEHAGNDIPEDYEFLFDGADQILNSHRGWDLGALELAERLSKETESALFSYPYTRLFIEPNRSMAHPKLFSEFTRNLPKSEKLDIIKTYYQPYRNEVIEAIKKNASENITTIHIGVHTFTPVFEENERNFEIGLLYDPQRKSEKHFCRFWKSLLKQTFREVRIRMNQPYKGASDGFTTYLRKIFDEEVYLGIELEVNQKLYWEDAKWNLFCLKMSESFGQLQKKSCET